MQQAVNAAKINKRTVIGDVLDHAVNHLAFGKVLHQLGALFGAGFFHDGAARDNNVAALAVHFQNLERLRHMHQRTNVTDRTDVNLRAGQEGHSTAEIDGEATLDAAEDHAIDALILGGHFFEADPGFFALGLFAAEHGFAQSVFDALEINFNGRANLDVGVLARLGKVLEWNAAFGLEADVNDHQIVFNGKNLALDDRALGYGAVGIALFEEGFKVIDGWGSSKRRISPYGISCNARGSRGSIHQWRVLHEAAVGAFQQEMRCRDHHIVSETIEGALDIGPAPRFSEA